MEKKYIASIINYKEEEIISIEELLNNPEKYNICHISISHDDDYQHKKGLIKLINTDYEHPLRLEKDIFSDDFYIKINEEYFKKNKEEILNLINTICKKTTNEEIKISQKELICKDILKTLKENDHLKKITLTNDYEEDKYTLTEEVYQLFKTAKIPKEIMTPLISKELEENYDPIIGFNNVKKLIGTNTYPQLISKNHILNISTDLTKEEIVNLKYITPNKKININLTNYKNVAEILEKLMELNIEVELTIKVENKEIFNKTPIFKNSDKYKKLNIQVEYEFKNYNLEDYKKFENILYLFLSPIKDRNYSPFEKYIYAYNIVKRFKKYQEVGDNGDKLQSRNLYDILLNDYMVCVGYADMFKDLLEKLGIPCDGKSVSVGIENEEENMEFEGHRRIYVHLQDSKYKIDGFYTSDPTWDNDLNKDYYNYLALTASETTKDNLQFHSSINSKYDFYLDTETLYSSSSVEEFNAKINYIINKKLDVYITKCKEKKEIYDLDKQISAIFETIITKLIDRIKILDKDKYNEIITKYQLEETHLFMKTENISKKFPNIIEYLGTYIISKVNNPIPGKTIIDAAMVVNKDVLNLTEEEEIAYRNYLIEINRNRQALAFPKREIENMTTGEITYENEFNKFDFDEYQQESEKVR